MDYSLTPGLVKASATGLGKAKRGTLGETVAAGDAIYRDPDAKVMLLADANGVANQLVDGIALTGGGAGQPVVYVAEDSQFDLGVTVGSGQVVVLSDTPGKLAPDEDSAAGWLKVVMGVGIGGTKIALRPLRGGAV